MAANAQININVNSATATKSVEKLNGQIMAAGGSSASLRAELKKTITELQNLAPGTARFTELSAKAAALKEQIADTNDVVGQLAGNFTERLTRGISSAVGIGIAGFQALSAAQVLFGTENEELNKSLAQMTALLNLSQAIETFGGLDQKIVEIKALFESLLPVQEASVAATEAQAVAVEGQGIAQNTTNIATEAGVVATTNLTASTTALGLAMKALPIVALVASLAALGYGIYSYFSNSEEARKSEEKRKKQLEELKKEQEDFNKSLASETGGFLLLVERIKSTNSQSSERVDLLKQLNKEYGINLQNITDETQLLNGLDTATEKYISYQKTKLLLSKNQEKFNKYLEQSIQAEKDLKTAQDAYAKNVPQLNEQLTKYGDNMGAIRGQIDKYQKAVDVANSKNNKINQSLQNLTRNANTYNKTLTDLNKTIKTQEQLEEERAKKEAQREKARQNYQDYLKKYADLLSAVKDMEQKAYDAQTALLTQREAQGKIVVDLVERERDARLASIKKVYEDTRKDIEKTIKDKQKQSDALQKLDKAYSDYLEYEDNQRVERTQYISKLILEEQTKLQNSLTLESEKGVLDREIVLDEEVIKSNEAELQKLEYRLKSNNLSLEEYKKIKLAELEILKENLQKEKEILSSRQEKEKLDFDKTIKDRIAGNDKYILEAEKGEDGFYTYKLKLSEKGLAEKAKLDEEGQKLYEQNVIDTETELNNQVMDIRKKQSDETIALNEQTNEQIKENTEQTNQEIEQSTLDMLMNVADQMAEIFNNVSSLISQYSQQNMDIALTQLDDANQLAKDQLDQQLAQQLISREEYDNKVAQLEQQKQQKELQIKRKNFRTEKALNLVGATIDGARAVLSAFAGTTGGIIVKSVAAALAGVFAATQIALIARQEFKAARGGIVPGNGSGDMDTVPSRLAPGEVVINSSSSQQFLPLLSAINEVGGGKSLVPDLPPTVGQQKFQPVFNTDRPQQIVKAYVVESELSQVQRRVNRIERSTSF